MIRLLLIGLLLVVGCGASARDAVRVSLNTISASVDPAYATAVAACDAREAYVEATVASREEYEARIAPVRADCDRAFGAFEAVRQAHTAAVDVFESGAALNAVFNAFERLQAAWAALREVWR